MELYDDLKYEKYNKISTDIYDKINYIKFRVDQLLYFATIGSGMSCSVTKIIYDNYVFVRQVWYDENIALYPNKLIFSSYNKNTYIS